jgi:hypothetical protein
MKFTKVILYFIVFFPRVSLSSEVFNEALLKGNIQGVYSETQTNNDTQQRIVGVQALEFSFANNINTNTFSQQFSLLGRESSFLCLGGTELKLTGSLASRSAWQFQRSRLQIGLGADFEKSGLDECRSGPRGVLGLGNDSDLQAPRFLANIEHSIELSERTTYVLGAGYSFFKAQEKTGTLTVLNSIIYESSSVSQETISFRYLRQGVESLISEEINPFFRHTHNLTEFTNANFGLGFARVLRNEESEPLYLLTGLIEFSKNSELVRLLARYSREISSRDPTSPRFYADSVNAEASRRLFSKQLYGVLGGIRIERGEVSFTATDEMRKSFEAGLKHFYTFFGFDSQTPLSGIVTEYKAEVTDSESFKLIRQYIQTGVDWQF